MIPEREIFPPGVQDQIVDLLKDPDVQQRLEISKKKLKDPDRKDLDRILQACKKGEGIFLPQKGLEKLRDHLVNLKGKKVEAKPKGFKAIVDRILNIVKIIKPEKLVQKTLGQEEMKMGYEALAKGDNKGAIFHFMNAVGHGVPRAHFYVKQFEEGAKLGDSFSQNEWAKVLLKDGKFKEAAKLFLKAAKDPELKGKIPFVESGDKFANEGELKLAEKMYKAAGDAGKAKLEALRARVAKEALEQAGLLVKKAPLTPDQKLKKAAKHGDADAQMSLGKQYLDAGKLKEAEKWFRAAKAELRLEAEFHLNELGQQYEKRKKFQSAERVYKAAGKAGQANLEALPKRRAQVKEFSSMRERTKYEAKAGVPHQQLSWGETLLTEGRLNEAEKWLKRTINNPACDKDSKRVAKMKLVKIGEAYENNRDFDDALRAYKAAGKAGEAQFKALAAKRDKIIEDSLKAAFPGF